MATPNFMVLLGHRSNWGIYKSWQKWSWNKEVVIGKSCKIHDCEKGWKSFSLCSPQSTVTMQLQWGQRGPETKMKSKQINRMHKEYSVFFLICGMSEIILFCVEQTAALLCCYGDAIFIEDAVRASQFVNTEGQVVFMKEPINSTSAKYNFSSFHSPFERMCKRNHIGFVLFILMISH